MGKPSKPAQPAVRDFYVAEATHSFRRLRIVLNDLTEAEVIAALKLERSTRRRPTLVRLLTAQATKLHLRNFNATLEEKIHGT